MFASRTRWTVQVPGDDGTTVNVVLQRLSGRNLDKASELRQAAIAEHTARLGGAVVQAFREKPSEPQSTPTPEEQRKARYLMYDRAYALSIGVHDWDARRPDGEKVPLKEGLADLDETCSQSLFEQLLDRSLPPLDVKAVEEQEGNA